MSSIKAFYSRRAAHIVGLVLLFVFAFGYYLDIRHADFNQMSGDQWVTTPIIMHMLDSSLFKGDMYAGNPEGYSVYNTWYVQTAAFFCRLAHGDILQGHRVFHLLLLVTYCLLWYGLLLKITRNAWLALLLTLLARATITAPGDELWGIGGFYTLLPRTVFSALLPLGLYPMILYQENARRNRLWLAAFVFGIIGNFHSASALPVFGAVMLASFCYDARYQKMQWKDLLLRYAIAMVIFLLGMASFIFSFLNHQQQVSSVTPELFNQMLTLRSGIYARPFELLGQYFYPDWWLMVWLPVMASVWVYRKEPALRRQIFFLYALIAGLFIVPLAVYAGEYVLAQAGIAQLNISFQLIRAVKYVLLPAFLLVGIMLQWIGQQQEWKITRLSIASLIIYLLLAAGSRTVLSQVPGLRYSIFRSQWPDSFTTKPFMNRDYADEDTLCTWVNAHLKNDTSLFEGPPQLRPFCQKSMPLDFKGAGILMTISKQQYFDWASRYAQMLALPSQYDKMQFYRNNGITYWATVDTIGGVQPLFVAGKYNLYKIR